MSGESIKSIILDVGGVIINIDYHKTSIAFQKLGVDNFDIFYSQKSQNHLFTDYETGVIHDNEFRDKLRNELNLNVDDIEIDNAWNAMLLDIPNERIDCIRKLRQKYKLFLFSNTNEIHMKELNYKLNLFNNMENLDALFDNSYYSYKFGYRKPNPESFEKIIELNSLKKHETIFVDDSIQHILGAQEAGLNTVHLNNNLDLLMLDQLINEERYDKRFL